MEPLSRLLRYYREHEPLIIMTICWALALILVLVLVFGFPHSVEKRDENRRLITVYDRGVQSVFLTDAKTIGQALRENGVMLDGHDAVEPETKEELVAPDYKVNIYRARPVTVVDGAKRVKVMSAYQTPVRIAKDAGIHLYPEDKATVTRSNDLTGEGAGLQLSIERSTPLTLDLYGRKQKVRTLGKTVKELLEEKNIVLGERGRVSVKLSTPIKEGMSIRVWREGRQTIYVDQPIAFETQRIQDADRPVGYKSVRTKGKNGVLSISYEVEIKNGQELSRKEIARIISERPVKQVEIVGIKSRPGALTAGKGAQYFVDSRGISHRETYYDLDMHVVMQFCGQGGYYEVRVDGVKVDRDGYVIIAANLNRYPRCSVVETSVGPAKVYDTGGFALRHPEGFDIATDWTNYNGN